MTRVKLERWLGHLSAARERGVSLAHYAREHRVSRHTLYAAQRQWQSEQAATAKRGRRAAPGGARVSSFVAVQVMPAASAVRARLPNGVQLEFGDLEASACSAVVGMLAALPCSG
ncbi:MAG: hypothetical protein H7X75_11520 [Burkholderiaceae bacterium]|nr:hypothetical protein [Burkholderiaceae bacterium]